MRFERELEKLATYDYAAIVIESSLKNCLVPAAYSRMNPKSVVNSLLAWSIKYGVHVWFAENRKLAETLTYRLLEKYYKERCVKNMTRTHVIEEPEK